MVCATSKLRPACAYAQSDQSLCLSLEYSMTVKLLTEHDLELLSLKGGCTGSSESALVKMPHCWKSHVVAHLCFRRHFLSDFKQYGMCDQQSLRSACAYAQSDQSLCLSLEYSMIVKLLTEQHLEFLSLTLNAPMATKVVCFSHLLKCLRSLYGKQCGPRPDCSYRSSLFWVHPVCFHT